MPPFQPRSSLISPSQLLPRTAPPISQPFVSLEFSNTLWVTPLRWHPAPECPLQLYPVNSYSFPQTLLDCHFLSEALQGLLAFWQEELRQCLGISECRAPLLL